MIVATGPVSSGTRLMTKVLAGWGLEVEHRSMPHWEEFWSWKEYPADTRFVIMLRRPDFSIKSAYMQGHGDPAREGWRHRKRRMTEDDLMQWWWRAMEELSGFPRCWWVSYEALVASPEQQMGNLAHWLGLDSMPPIKPRIHDRNEKWR